MSLEASCAAGGVSSSAATGRVIAADARLDNRESLFSVLGVAHSERCRWSDSRLILAAFEKWGEDTPAHLLGDYAFAILDAAAGAAFCARDPIGARPFYYCVAGARLVFASDLQQVLGAPGVSDELDEGFIAAHLWDYQFAHGERTFFRAIRKLPPGHSLSLSSGSAQLRQYWFPEEAPDVRLGSDAEYEEAFRDLLEQAVMARSQGSGAVGVHATGGLDSSAIAVLAARELRRQNRPLTAYSWQPPPEKGAPPHAEVRRIRAVCDQEGIEVQYHATTADDLIEVLQRDPVREPTVDTLMYELQVQRRATAQDVRVLLSGWGGDECATFNGRGYYPALLASGRWLKLYRQCRLRTPHPLRFLVRRGLLPLCPVWVREGAEKLRPQSEPYRNVRTYINRDFCRERADEIEALKGPPWREVGVRSVQLQSLRFGYLTRRIESWAASAAPHGITYSYPFLDRRLIEFALGLPPEQFIRGAVTRRLARRALVGWVPDEVRENRDKNDPYRLAAADPLYSQAFRRIGRRLASRTSPPTRSKYIRTDLLTRRLVSDEPIRWAEQRGLWDALQFLDF